MEKIPVRYGAANRNSPVNMAPNEIPYKTDTRMEPFHPSACSIYTEKRPSRYSVSPSPSAKTGNRFWKTVSFRK